VEFVKDNNLYGPFSFLVQAEQPLVTANVVQDEMGWNWSGQKGSLDMHCSPFV
jgi:hypothetical protein